MVDDIINIEEIVNFQKVLRIVEENNNYNRGDIQLLEELFELIIKQNKTGQSLYREFDKLYNENKRE